VERRPLFWFHFLAAVVGVPLTLAWMINRRLRRQEVRHR
jgi:hypothetical protein